MALTIFLLVALELLVLSQGSGVTAVDDSSLAAASWGGITDNQEWEGFNLTGTLRGKWSVLKGIEGVDDENATTLKPWLRQKNGPTVISLEAATPEGGVSYVHGMLTLRDGEFAQESDALLPFEGVYVLRTGELRLVLETRFVGNVTEAEKRQLGRTYRDALTDLVEELKGKGSSAAPRVARLSDLATLQPGGGVDRLRKRCTAKLNAVVVNGTDDLGDPAATFSGVLFSPNCGFQVAVNATQVHLGHYYAKAENFSLMMTVATMFLISLVHQQMEHSGTGAGMAAVSLLCIGQQAVIDSYLCLVHLTTGLVVDDLFGAFAGTAFMEFILFSFFEMKFMVMVWKARRPEQFNQGNWRREMGVLHSYFYVALLAGVFLVYQLSEFAEHVIFAFFSFWVWQIAHNVKTDTPRPLLPKYVLGTSAARLLLPLYIFGCPKNFIRSGPESQEYGFCAALVAWVAFQAAVLHSQSRWGARWFVPRRWRPQKYDYHREVPQSVLDGLGHGDEEEGEAGGIDCVVCMAPVDVHRLDARMVTPCDHFFHNACMLRWMQVKLECPTCRRPLPTP